LLQSQHHRNGRGTENRAKDLGKKNVKKRGEKKDSLPNQRRNRGGRGEKKGHPFAKKGIKEG